MGLVVFCGMNVCRCFWGLLWACCMNGGVPAGAESLVKIAGYEVTGTEFNYFYRKAAASGRMSAGDFLPHFVNFKLKVIDAKNRGWDTLPDYRLLCKTLEGELVKERLMDTEQSAQCVRAVYERSLHRLEQPGWVKVEQLSVLFPQCAGRREVEKALAGMQKGYDLAVQGQAMARCLSAVEAGSGKLLLKEAEWLPLSALTDEFVGALEAVRPGECTRPFVSPLGVHMVRLVERSPAVSFDVVKGFVSSLLEERDEWTRLALDGAALHAWKRREAPWTADLQWRMREVQEGLLAARWDALHTVRETAVDDAELERYFREHRERYRWELPHFRGGIVWCRSKKAASKIRKLLKKQDYRRWRELLEERAAADSLYAGRVETGVFRIGSHEVVDRLVYKCGAFAPDRDFPYVFVIGKKLKKGPEVYTDVLERVTMDVKREREDVALKELKEKYKVEYSEEILKSVNFAVHNEY